MKDIDSTILAANRVRIEALEITSEALLLKIAALMTLNANIKEQILLATPDQMQYEHLENDIPIEKVDIGQQRISEAIDQDAKVSEKNRSKIKPEAVKEEDPFTNWKPGTAEWLKQNLSEENVNAATINGLTKVLVHFFNKGSATASNLADGTKISKASISKYNALLKKLNLIAYLGTKRHGHFILTTHGRRLYMEITKNRI